ncbi:MAG: hypothetical protein JNM90_09090 [Burkholderiales bacterium]|nr:hypothetical protein [Burkholderiales bacterium]
MKLATMTVLAFALLLSACAPFMPSGGGRGHAAHSHGSHSSADWLASQPISWSE